MTFFCVVFKDIEKKEEIQFLFYTPIEENKRVKDDVDKYFHIFE